MGDAKSGSKQDFISTREAAVRLGVALSTIQSWVETGILPAWKTAGGHRRIPADAVDALLMRQKAVLSSVPSPDLFKVLVVEDDPVQRELYRRQFNAWRLPIQLLTAEDGFEGLMLIGRHSPDLIITDLAMPEMDGFKMIRRLKTLPAAIRGGVIVVTALTPAEIEAEGGLPAGLPVYPKPIPFAALRPVLEHMTRAQAA
jgi:excisionase family DNA binding protein